MTKSQIQVHLNDGMGKTVVGELLRPSEWPEWATQLVNGEPLVGVATVAGRIYVVRAVVESNAICWKQAR